MHRSSPSASCTHAHTQHSQDVCIVAEPNSSPLMSTARARYITGSALAGPDLHAQAHPGREARTRVQVGVADHGGLHALPGHHTPPGVHGGLA